MANNANWTQAVSGGGMTGPPQAGIGTTPGYNPVTQAMQNTESIGGSINDLLSNKNFQVFLAELGAQLDPEGAGMVAKPFKSYLQRDALSQALAGGNASVKFGADGSLNIQQKEQTQGQGGGSATEPSTDNALTQEGETGLSQSNNYGLFDRIANDLMGE